MSIDFFNALSIILRIELSEQAQPTPPLMNLRAPASATLVSLKAMARVVDQSTDPADRRELTEGELALVVLEERTLALQSDCDDNDTRVAHTAPNGQFFTVRDMIAAVEQTERQTRGSSDWLDGIDVHHIYFEGIREEGDGHWSIAWGS